MLRSRFAQWAWNADFRYLNPEEAKAAAALAASLPQRLKLADAISTHEAAMVAAAVARAEKSWPKIRESQAPLIELLPEILRGAALAVVLGAEASFSETFLRPAVELARRSDDALDAGRDLLAGLLPAIAEHLDAESSALAEPCFAALGAVLEEVLL